MGRVVMVSGGEGKVDGSIARVWEDGDAGAEERIGRKVKE
jgi:hypothetical protein